MNNAADTTADMATSPPAQAILPPPPDTALTPAAQTLQLRDAKPPVPLANPWPAAITALLLALLLTALVAWLLHQRRRRLAPATIVLPPPHRRASDQLHAALSLIHDPKAFMTAVANTLRTYLEERFQLHAPERTTEEFLLELPACPELNSRQTELLADFLRHSDLVKFARLEPSEPELRGLWQTAHRLVVETSPSVDGTPGHGSPPARPPAPDTQQPTQPDQRLRSPTPATGHNL